MKVHKITLLFLFTIVLNACGGSGGNNNNTNGTVEPTTNDTVSVSNGYYNSRIVVRNAQGQKTGEFRDEIDVVNNVITGFSINVNNGSEFQDLQFRYNDSGYQTQLEVYAENGSLSRRTDYTHNEQGYLISSRRENFADTSNSRDVAFEYDVDNKLIRTVYRTFDGVVSTMYEYEHNSDGTFSTRNGSFFQDGQPSSQGVKTYSYDNQNRINVIENDFNMNGAIDERLELEYDANGNVFFVTIFNADGTINRTNEYGYILTGEPIFNRWVRALKYFP